MIAFITKCRFLLLTFLVMVCSCKQNKSFLKAGADTSNGGTKSKQVWEKYLKEAKKDHEIYHAYELSDDTIFLLRRSIGMELSIDGGKKWEWIGKQIPRLDEFTIDDRRIWWGLVRWKGIHEPSRCFLWKSTDSGVTWKIYTFNPNVFFPYHFYSNTHEPLAITNYWDNKVYLLKGADPQHNWHYIKQIDQIDPLSDISINPYFVSRENDDNKLYVKRKNGIIDTLLHFKNAYNIYYVEKDKEVIYAAGAAENGEDSYFAIIKKEHLDKEFTLPGGDLEMKKTNLNHILLCGMSGAYILKKDSLIHIYK
jgi:hypothetical protein